jgi:hypothetical protein
MSENNNTVNEVDTKVSVSYFYKIAPENGCYFKAVANVINGESPKVLYESISKEEYEQTEPKELVNITL